MKLFVPFLSLCLVSTTCYASHIEEELVSNFMLDESTVDKSLSADEAIFVITFRNALENEIAHKVTYSIDGKTKTAKLDEKRSMEIKTTPGSHVFQFYYSSDYYEVYTPSVIIQGGNKDYYSVFLEHSEMQIMTEKPIIYLYPETNTEVTVKVNPTGKLTFTYPEYNDGWTFEANPNGDLTFGENTYNYLFWESSQRYALASNQTASGFLVPGEEVTLFLKEKLTEAGLTSEEQSDFITFWAPRLTQNKMNFIHFEFNESCNRFAELDITPQPDNVYRIYMLWYPTTQTLEPKAQEIPTVDRSGFTVVEWGGQDLTNMSNSTSSH